MPVQQSLSFEEIPGRTRREGRPATQAEVVLVTGTTGNDAAARLLERALAESGLAAHDPVEVGHAGCLPPAHWRRRAPRLVVAFGAEAASGLLRRSVSLNLERGKMRPLADGGRVLVTEHPRVVLGIADPVARGREYRRLVNDLMLAVPRRRLAA
jgi:uracil-DNA glycosylase